MSQQQTVTICTYDRKWQDAIITGVGTDSLQGTEDVLLVRHPHFGEGTPLEFYREEEDGKHYNVGNHAFWIV